MQITILWTAEDVAVTGKDCQDAVEAASLIIPQCGRTMEFLRTIRDLMRSGI